MNKPRAIAVIHGVLASSPGREQLQPVTVEPVEVRIERNDYRTADTCRMTIAWPRFTVDPRQFVAAGVDVYMGTAGGDGQLILGTESIAFSGHVDDFTQRAGSDGVELSLEARDFTALFLDAPWSSTVPLGGLAATLQSIVDSVPGAKGLTVRLSDIADVNLKATNGRTRYSPPDRANAWTVMTDLCRKVGAVIYVDLNEVVVAGPRTLSPQTAAPTLLWGRDLTRLELSQELKAEAQRGVKVTSWDPETGEVVEAKYPSQSKRVVVDQRRRKAETTENYMEWFVAGVPKGQASSVAQRIYEAQARNQAKARAETHRMVSVDGAWDLYRLKHSDPVTIVAPSRALAGMGNLADADMLAYLQGPSVGMTAGVAEAFVAARDALHTNDLPFYCRRARHSLGADDGYQLSLELATYVNLGA